MPSPLLGILVKVGELILPKVGSLFKGKATNAGVATIAVGVAAALATNENPFESAKILVDLAEQAWPHLVIIVGALLSLAGWFRKTGWAAASSEPKDPS